MAYANITEVDNILGQALTSATNPNSQARRNLLTIGKVRDKNVIPDDIVNQYIQWASSEIDGILSQQYKTPFCEKVHFQTNLISDVSDYNSYIVLDRACALTAGDNIILTDGAVEERHIIDEVVGNAVFSTLDPIGYPFLTGTRLLHVKFPDPIAWIAVRLSAANIYDKYFAAQASPDVSEYGKHLRTQAQGKINDILKVFISILLKT